MHVRNFIARIGARRRRRTHHRKGEDALSAPAHKFGCMRQAPTWVQAREPLCTQHPLEWQSPQTRPPLERGGLTSSRQAHYTCATCDLLIITYKPLTGTFVNLVTGGTSPW